jgi:hypothetical protein
MGVNATFTPQSTLPAKFCVLRAFFGVSWDDMSSSAPGTCVKMRIEGRKPALKRRKSATVTSK